VTITAAAQSVSRQQSNRDPRRREVVVHRERSAAHHRLLVVLRVVAARQRDRAGVGRERAVELLVSRGDPRVELHRGPRSVGEIEVDERVGDGRGVDAATRDARAGPVPKRGVAVPAHDDEHGLGDSRRDGRSRVHDAGTRAGTTHVRGRRVAHVGDAEVGRELLDGRVSGRRDDAVDVGRGEAGVGDRVGGGVEHELDRKPVGRASERGLGDARDRHPARESGLHRR
jgi:hypothetical protein